MKRTMSLSLLAGLAAALLLGGGATAQATGGHQCSNSVANVVTCNDTTGVVPVTIKIQGDRTLSDTELSVLEDTLNNTDVDVDVLKSVVVETYDSFDPAIAITVEDVDVCVAMVCG